MANGGIIIIITLIGGGEEMDYRTIIRFEWMDGLGRLNKSCYSISRIEILSII